MTAPADDPTIVETRRRRVTWLRRLIWIVLLVGIVAFLVEGADNPPDPTLVPDETGAEAASEPAPPDGPEDLGAAAVMPTTTTSDPPAAPTTAPPATSNPGTTTGPNPVPSAPTTVAAPTPAPVPPTTAPAPARRPLPGFGEVAFRITRPAGDVTNGVALLADDGASRGRGLMEQTDLRGYDAMVFRFPAPSEGGFFMRNTLIPLSIAFFDAGGRFVSSADMEPCPDEVEDCPTTGADGPYLHAIEVAQGDLPGLGIGPGADLSFP